MLINAQKPHFVTELPLPSVSVVSSIFPFSPEKYYYCRHQKEKSLSDAQYQDLKNEYERTCAELRTDIHRLKTTLEQLGDRDFSEIVAPNHELEITNLQREVADLKEELVNDHRQ